MRGSLVDFIDIKTVMSFNQRAPSGNEERFGNWNTSREYSRTFNQTYHSQQLHDSKWYEEKSKESLKESLRTAATTNEIGQRTAEHLTQQTGNCVLGMFVTVQYQ